MIFQIHRRFAAVISLLLMTCLSAPAHATSIRQLGFDEVVGAAEFVFAGRVVASIARWNQAGNRIHTYVTFEVEQVLQDTGGEFTGTELTLRFAGGSVGDARLVYQEMRYPQLGEQGVYFVATLTRTMVNPLVGWSQGHFKTVMVDGVVRMQTADDQVITGVRAGSGSINADAPSAPGRNGNLEEGQPRPSRVEFLSRGHADGLIVSEEKHEGMSKQLFVDTVRARIEQLKE